MTPHQIQRVRDLAAKQFNTRDIARVTGLDSREIHRVRTGKALYLTDPVAELRKERPVDIPVDEWERLIHMNFVGSGT